MLFSLNIGIYSMNKYWFWFAFVVSWTRKFEITDGGIQKP